MLLSGKMRPSDTGDTTSTGPNPFDMADISSLYAFDEEEVARRERLRLEEEEEEEKPTWCCGRYNRPATWVLIVGAVAIAVVVLALSLGLGLGLGLKKRNRDFPSADDGNDDNRDPYAGPAEKQDTVWGGQLAYGGSVDDGDVPMVVLSEEQVAKSGGFASVLSLLANGDASGATPAGARLPSSPSLLASFAAGASLGVVDARGALPKHTLLLQKADPARTKARASTTGANCSCDGVYNFTAAMGYAQFPSRCEEGEDCPVEQRRATVTASLGKAILRADNGDANSPSTAEDVAYQVEDVLAHLTWVNAKCFEAAASGEFPPYPFAAQTLDSTPEGVQSSSAHAPSPHEAGETEAKGLVLPWPAPLDTLRDWRGGRYNSARAAHAQGRSVYGICNKGSKGNGAGVNVSAVSDVDLYFQARSLFNVSWYATQLSSDALSDAMTATAEQLLDNLVGLSSTHLIPIAGAAPCDTFAARDDAFTRLWASASTSAYYAFSTRNDSVTISPLSTSLEDVFAGVLAVCRCPAGGIHRFFALDALSLSFRRYHECLLQTVSYQLSTARPLTCSDARDVDDTNSGGAYSLVRVYSAPVGFIAVGPPKEAGGRDGTAVDNSARAANACLAWGSSATTSVVTCALLNGLRYQQRTEGVRLGALSCPRFKDP